MLFITGGCIFLGLRANDVLNTEYGVYGALFLWALLTILWFIYGRRPAAWVNGNTLYIRDGHFKAASISKENIEYIKYKKNSEEEHELIVKIPEFSEWHISIHDKKEHIDDNRLYAFINEHFHEL